MLKPHNDSSKTGNSLIAEILNGWGQQTYLAKDKCIEDKGVFHFISMLPTFIL